jgi:hypothetical protein
MVARRPSADVPRGRIRIRPCAEAFSPPPFPSFSPAQPVLPAGLNAADFYVIGTDGDFVIVSYAQG